MTYSDEMKKREQARFAEIFEITQGVDTQYYTSYESELIFQSQTYEPAPIKRSAFTFDKQLRAHRMKLTTQITELAQRYIANAPAEPVTIKVTRFIIDSPTLSRRLFTGKITAITVTTGVAEIEAESNTIVFKNKLPVWLHQGFCNNQLYHVHCGVDQNTFKVETAITVSGNDLISTAFGAFADQYFTLGHVNPKNLADIRLITNHVGNNITLQFPFDSRIFTGVIVLAFPGCDKKPDTCRTKFNNFDNPPTGFKGFPFIPSNNPVVYGVDV
jgi:uncharacterized phage protein (TIGR02218 family)